MEIKYKQFVIIPKRPKMSKGKIASQVAHATFMALDNQLSQQLKSQEGPGDLRHQWKTNGMCVIVKECKDEIKLHGIAKYLEQWKIPYHLYIDEGLTEIEMGTATALATGVMTEDQFWMLGTMELLK